MKIGPEPVKDVGGVRIVGDKGCDSKAIRQADHPKWVCQLHPTMTTRLADSSIRARSVEGIGVFPTKHSFAQN